MLTQESLVWAAVTERFHHEWEAERPTSIRTLVDDWKRSEPTSSHKQLRALVLELIKIDLEQRWMRRTPSEASDSGSKAAGTEFHIRPLEAYFDDVGDFEFDENAILELMAHEYRVRHRWGDRPQLDEFAERFLKLGRAALSRLESELTVEQSLRGLLIDFDDSMGEGGFGPPDLDENAAPSETLGLLFSTIRPFTDLAPHVLDALALDATVQRFAAGDVLLSQGAAADCLFVILDGTVEVSVVDGGVTHSIARLERHAIVGELGVFAKVRRSATVAALTDCRAAMIRREQLERLVASDPSVAMALSELISERVGTQNVDVLWGKVLNGYRVQGRLGRGSMGIVYAAAEVASNRALALKMLRHDLVFDRSALRRFRQEAAIIQSLKHTNIVRVFGEFFAYGTCFIAMELCDGLPLGEYLSRSGPLSEKTVFAILGQLSSALAHAHRAGVAHRDVKPSNILVSHDGTLKLTDFGLARRPVNDASTMTIFGQILGTPRYMAPEQIAGERGDDRSDVFALGAVAYELLSGRPLFRAARFHELLCERQAWIFPPRSEFRADLDDRLFRLLQTCLANDPRSRRVDWKELESWAAPIDWNVERSS